MLSSYTPAIIILAVSLTCMGATTPNIVLGLLLAELFGVGLYVLYASLSAHLDALHVAIGSLFIVCLATSESAVGLSLLIFNFVATGNIHGAQLNTKAHKPVGQRHNSTGR